MHAQDTYNIVKYINILKNYGYSATEYVFRCASEENNNYVYALVAGAVRVDSSPVLVC